MLIIFSSTGEAGETEWLLERGMVHSEEGDCRLRAVGNPGSSWNIARRVLGKEMLPNLQSFIVAVPVMANRTSDPRYWPQLVVQVVRKGEDAAQKLNGSTFNPYLRGTEPQVLMSPLIGPGAEQVILLLTKRTTAPVDVDVCIGEPQVSAQLVAGADDAIENPARRRDVEPVRPRSAPGLEPVYFSRLLDAAAGSCRTLKDKKFPTSAERIRYRADLLENAAYLFARTERPEYLNCSIQLITELSIFANNPGAVDLPHAHALRALTLADSWLYKSLEAGQERAIGQAAGRLIKRIRDAESVPDSGWAWQYAYNYKHAFTGALGIACERFDFPGGAECRQNAAEEGRRILQAMPSDGSSLEGPGYWNYSLVWILGYLRVLDQARLVGVIGESEFLQNASLFRLHVSVPGFSAVIPYGDTEPREYNRAGTALRGLASVLNDKLAAELARRVTDARWPRVDFVWRDDAWATTGSVPNTLTSLPTYISLPDQGISIWRSSWDSEHAELVFFKAGPLQGEKLRSLGVVFGGHNHPDQGQILFHSGGKWILSDDGYTPSKQTSQHNVATFGSTGQIGEGGPWFSAKDITPGDPPITNRIELRAEGILVSAELANAYPPAAGVGSWRRMVAKSIGQPLFILDSFQHVAEKGADLWFHSAAELNLTDSRGICLGQNAGLTMASLPQDALRWPIPGPAMSEGTVRFGLHGGTTDAAVVTVISTTEQEDCVGRRSPTLHRQPGGYSVVFGGFSMGFPE